MSKMQAKKESANKFLSISVHLTGYDKMDLLGTGMLDAYYDVIDKSDPTLVSAFLTKSEEILKDHSKDIDAEIERKLLKDNQFAVLTKNIILMWYLGSWKGEVINPQSYIQGLVWKAADTHPPGAKQPGYASWHYPPVSNQARADKPSAKAKTSPTV